MEDLQGLSKGILFVFSVVMCLHTSELSVHLREMLRCLGEGPAAAAAAAAVGSWVFNRQQCAFVGKKCNL